MAKIADGGAKTFPINLLGEACEVTVYQTSKTVFIAEGIFKGANVKGSGRTMQGALGRWRHLAIRSED